MGELAWNPLLDEWKKVNPPFVLGQSRWDRPRSTLEQDLLAFKAREQTIRDYAFSVPTPDAIRTVVKFAPRIVEIGAGTGYWAKLLKDAGAEVVAFDSVEPGAHNDYFARSQKGQKIGRWFPVQFGTEPDLRDHKDRALFMAWPPYEAPMARVSVETWGGDIVIYVGESEGGCTADDSFFALLNTDFEEVECVQIPQWYGLNDWLWIYRRLGVPVKNRAIELE